MYWDVQPVNTSFAIAIPRDSAPGTVVGTAKIHSDRVPIALLHFEIKIGAPAETVVPLPSQERQIKGTDRRHG
jgi:hypothetical protein